METQEESLCWSQIVQRALHQCILSETAPKAFIYHLEELENIWKQLFDAFPRNTLHAFALKACPVKGILALAFNHGFGAECASIGEVYLAKSFGCPTEKIVFDSPVKTTKDLKLALESGVYINADNFEELEKIQELLEKDEEVKRKRAQVGLRINPQIGSGLIKETSTASAQSKFGVPLEEKHEEIIQCFQRYPFLRGIHVHVGSQGCTWELLEKGIRAGVNLLVQLQKLLPGQVTTFDIGGGLSADYEGLSQGASFEEYVSRLRRVTPELFEPSLQLITEFGRRLCAKAATFVSRVEYTKQTGKRNIVLCHVGADNFLRPVYLPQNWKHRILVLDKRGRNKSDKHQYPFIEQDIAGPLCFSGDIFATGRLLPRCEPGDWLVVLDSGAYTLSMYSRHTSQFVPAVYGFRMGRNDEPFQLLKKEESPQDLVHFWS